MSDRSKYKRAAKGDIAYNMMRMWQGAVGVTPEDGLISPAYVVASPFSGMESRYFSELFRTAAYMGEVDAHSHGIVKDRNRLYWEDFKQIFSISPPPAEQRAIARYVKHLDQMVSMYIRSKLRLIELFQEQRSAVIHDYITGGSGNRSGSNILHSPSEWPYSVPGHWKIMALKWTLRKLIDCEHKTAPATENSDFRVVRTTAIRNGQMNPDGTYCTTEAAFKDWTRRGLPEPGDVMFTREAPAGEACLVPPDMNLCLGQRTVLMKVNRTLYDPKFLIHMIYAGPPHLRIRIASQGSTVGHFNMDDIGSMHVLAPPVEEQRRLVAAIETKTRKLALATEAAEREIRLLREYRTRLVTDIVTGRLDVREAAASLPDADDEPGEMSVSDAILEEVDEADTAMDDLAEDE